ncbi:MAG: FAD-dependent oxidoreductase [Bryobacterales bacterium]|nr:FAD-dependent oxidoreductase [Bryobacterales bacterium]
MGTCFGCSVGGERTCVPPAPPPRPPSHAPVLIVGAGPAGMAAAEAASRTGAEVTVIDNNASPGGQIWRAEGRSLPDGVRLLRATTVVAALPDRVLLTTAGEISYDRLILCTGARELFLPFPGWTLPGVTGAGGLQALAKSGLVRVDGQRVVVAGSGPLLLAVAAWLARHGARVVRIAEQTPWRKLAEFAAAMPQSKWGDALRLGWHAGHTLRAGTWPVRYTPGMVELNTGQRLACDYLACGFGLIPSTEAAALLGCRIADGAVAVNEWQETSQAGIFAAGELTGIGGVDQALIEGEIAGLAAAGARGAAAALFTARAEAHRFRRVLADAFALRPELLQLAEDSTIVCRCENVALAQLRAHATWRAAKLQTRCGMGVCQGRVCGPATAALFGWPGAAEPVRPPLFPVPAERLA